MNSKYNHGSANVRFIDGGILVESIASYGNVHRKRQWNAQGKIDEPTTEDEIVIHILR